MDVYLVTAGLVANVVSVPSLAEAIDLYPEFEVVERTEINEHLNPGDTYT